MAEPVPAPQAPIFNLQAYSPAEIKEAVEKVGVKKANLPFLASFMLAIVAGGGVGFGALYYTIVASDPALSFATVRVVGGLVFTLGLALVLVGGAELFTGNNLIVMAWASGKVSTRTMLRNWAIVYLGNFVGVLGLIVLVFYSHHLEMNDGRIGLSVLNTAAGKIRPDALTLFFKGILCNVLVCAAVWLAYAGRSVTDKLLAVMLPVSAFIAAGFEHCVANMYFLPLAWLLVQTGHAPANFDASLITIPGIFHNLVPVTLGNVVGGAGFVGAVYWAIYRVTFGETR
jgi:formate transporter